MTSSDGNIFLSYSRRDTDFQKQVVAYLRGKGLNIWVDNEKLIPGTPIWETEIEKAIAGASAILVLLSPDSKNSEWVRREITLAEQTHKRIFPVLVRGDEDSSIPLRLITCQHVDLRKNEKTGLLALYNSLSEYLMDLTEQKLASRALNVANEMALVEEKKVVESKLKHEQWQTQQHGKFVKSSALVSRFWKANRRYVLGCLVLTILVIISIMIVSNLPSGKYSETPTVETSSIVETPAFLFSATPTKTLLPTVAMTLTPTIYPTPSGQLVYEESFDTTETNFAGYKYEIVDDGTGNIVLQSAETGIFSIAFGSSLLSDGTIEFDFKPDVDSYSAVQDGEWGISIEFPQDYQWHNASYYAVYIMPQSNRIDLDYMSNGQGAFISSGKYTFSAGTWYEVRVVLNSTLVLVYVDETLVVDAETDAFVMPSAKLQESVVLSQTSYCHTSGDCVDSAWFQFDNLRLWIP